MELEAQLVTGFEAMGWAYCARKFLAPHSDKEREGAWIELWKRGAGSTLLAAIAADEGMNCPKFWYKALEKGPGPWLAAANTEAEEISGQS